MTEHEWVEYMDQRTVCRLCGTVLTATVDRWCRGRIKEKRS